MIKVLTVATSDLVGGAAKAAYRLHGALKKNNIDAHMLVQNKQSSDYTIMSSSTNLGSKVRAYLDTFPNKFYKNRSNTAFSNAYLPFSNVVNLINNINPDIVHLHWVAGGMIRIEDLQKIKAPIVWSLHDMWVFTGGCHYDDFCEDFVNQCEQCEFLKSSNSILSRRNLKRKVETYNQLPNLTFIPTSQWMYSQIEKSHVNNSQIADVLHNPLDVTLFKPYDKETMRSYFNIPMEKKVILFGAIGVFSDKRKGFIQLKEALESLNIANVLLLIVGTEKPEIDVIEGFEIKYIPILQDDLSLPLIYNVADVTVVPSLQETFGQISSESLACGTPVVAFEGTGASDIVNHKENGYLAKPFESEDLAYGVEWILNHKNYNSLCHSARRSAVESFSEDVIAKNYINLYEGVIA